MSLRIYVDSYSDYKANEPLRFALDEETYDIASIEDRWQEPNAEYFQVRTVEDRLYLLRYDEHADEWTLQSGFDGDELLTRPGIELITVEPKSIREAESKIAGCEPCRGDEADLPFDWILADVLNKRGPYEFVLSKVARTLSELESGVPTDHDNGNTLAGCVSTDLLNEREAAFVWPT